MYMVKGDQIWNKITDTVNTVFLGMAPTGKLSKDRGEARCVFWIGHHHESETMMLTGSIW